MQVDLLQLQTEEDQDRLIATTMVAMMAGLTLGAAPEIQVVHVPLISVI